MKTSLGAYLALVYSAGFELVAIKMAYAACDSITTGSRAIGVIEFRFPDQSIWSVNPAE